MAHDKKGILELLKQDKIRNIIILAGIGGILLIYLSTLFSGSEKKKETTAGADNPVISVQEYEEKLEEKLKAIVSAITGEANPAVLVTLQSDTTQVYAADEKNSTENRQESQTDGGTAAQNNHDTETSYIILKDTSGNQHALKITEIQPEVKGVVVVSEKADDFIVQEKIINAMKTALGISSSRVYVAAAKDSVNTG